MPDVVGAPETKGEAVELICLDADDTLWHDMRFFHTASDAFAEVLAPFAELGVARERLAEVEERNIRHYGYGAKSFTLSMIETAVEIGGDALPASVVARLLAIGRALLAHPVELLDGIADTLAALADRAPLVLVTKGDLLHQEAKLAASGLGELFSGVEIVSGKTPETFARVFARHRCPADRALMAGDSLRSDVLPALAAGAWGVYVEQDGAWAHERAAEPADHPRFRRLERLADLPALVAAIGPSSRP